MIEIIDLFFLLFQETNERVRAIAELRREEISTGIISINTNK